MVSPTSIRSRILKGQVLHPAPTPPECFTHVDPFEDTESRRARHYDSGWRRFTHVDPFEDTESASSSISA